MPLRRRVQLGGAVAAFAFVATWFFAVHRASETAAPAASASSAPVPVISLRIETRPASASLSVDGRPVADRVLRGPALSRHEIAVEAPGYRPHTQTVELNGKPLLLIELTPVVEPTASA